MSAPLRCPDCWSGRVTVLSATPLWRSRGRLWPVECRDCQRFWWSSHRAVQREAERMAAPPQAVRS